MTQKTDEPRDLFGEPWTDQPDPRGRKRHRRVALIAENVAVLRANGHTIEHIARVVGLSEPTLRKYYLRELDNGSNLIEAVLDQVMWRKAKEGNVSAAKFVDSRLTRARAAEALRAREKREPELGVKEQRQQAAQRVGGKYAVPQAPKLTVN